MVSKQIKSDIPPQFKKIQWRLEQSPSPASSQKMDLKRLQDPDPLPEKDVTFFFWLNGNNEQQAAAWSTLRQLQYIGSDENMNLVAQVARPKGPFDSMTKDISGTYRYYVTKTDKPLTIATGLMEMLHLFGIPPFTQNITSPMIKNLGQSSMGNWKNFADAMLETMQKFPSKKFVVYMQGPSDGLNGVMRDDVAGESMSYQDMGKAFDYVKQKTGKSVDVLVSNFSGSANLELYAELAGKVGYAFGTQSPTAGFGLSPVSALYEIQRSYTGGFPRDPLEIARTFQYVAADSPASPSMFPTSSVFDLSKMPQVENAVKNLKDSLKTVPAEDLRTLIEATQEGGLLGDKPTLTEEKDLIHFAQQILNSKEIQDPKIKEAAQNVISAVNDALKGEVTLNSFYQHANGVNLFLTNHYGYLHPQSLPIPKDWDGKYHYEQTAFDQATGMHELLEKIAQEPTSNKCLGEKGANFLSAYLHGNLEPQFNAYGGFANLYAYLQSWSVQNGKKLPALGAAAGILAAIKNTVDSIRGLHWLSKKQKDLPNNDKRDFVYQRASNLLVNGAGIGLFSLASFVPALAPLAAPAAYAVAYKFILDQLYGYYSQYKHESDSVMFSHFLNDLRHAPVDSQARARLGEALINHLGSMKQWDKK
jgi:hypothetical protein